MSFIAPSLQLVHSLLFLPANEGVVETQAIYQYYRISSMIVCFAKPDDLTITLSPSNNSPLSLSVNQVNYSSCLSFKLSTSCGR